jgi:transposase
MPTAEEHIATLEAEVAALRAQVQELPTQNQELRASLAKDSHNSSKPPSSDPLARKRPRRQRRNSGKKPGGQLGHRGETLHLVAVPDEVVEHRPAVCRACQTPLDEAAPLAGYERRQVEEPPPVRLVVREHRAQRVRCPACAHLNVGAFPAKAPSRAQYGPGVRARAVFLVEQQVVPYARVRELLADLLGVRVSLETLTRWVAHAPVLHSNESGVRRAGKLAWAHVASTSRLTKYAIHPKRGSAATDAIGILPTYQRVSMHDGWKPYCHSTRCRHALGNIHHLRELTFLEEQEHHTWARDFTTLPLAMKAAVERARARGDACLDAAERRPFLRRYEELLAAGPAANPPPQCQPGQKGRLKQSPARNLLERLWKEHEAVLAFLDDVAIPFGNKQAEQDLRMLKVQQKIAGSFRADTGSEAFARIRGYLSSMHKQGVVLLAALQSVFRGQPLYPAWD